VKNLFAGSRWGEVGPPAAVVVFIAAPWDPAGPGDELRTLLLEHTLAQIRRAGLIGFLSLPAEPSGWTPPEGVAWLLQSGASPGAHLRQTFDRLLGFGLAKVLLVAPGCPELGAHHLVGALRALDDAPVALGPSGDGDFWLVGQRQAGWDLFSSLTAGDDRPLDQICARLRVLDLGWSELEILAAVSSLAELDPILRSERVERTLGDGLRRLVAGSQRSAAIS
jgi:hypothetical protein